MFRAIGTFSPPTAIAPPSKKDKTQSNLIQSPVIEDLLPSQFSTMLSLSTDSAIWGSDFGDHLLMGSAFNLNNNHFHSHFDIKQISSSGSSSASSNRGTRRQPFTYHVSRLRSAIFTKK